MKLTRFCIGNEFGGFFVSEDENGMWVKHSDYESALAEIRKALADYMQSEGCSCCRNVDAHEENKARLAELLGEKGGVTHIIEDYPEFESKYQMGNPVK